MKKFKLFIDVEKEEEWLNKMIRKGWLCERVGMFGSYRFIKSSAVNYVIRLDHQTFKNKADFLSYKTLYEDYGWKHIAGTKMSHTQYWMGEPDGDTELFSDRSSQISYYKRLMNYNGFFMIFILFFIMLFYSDKNFEAIWNPKAAYYTQGLWEMENPQFILGFLFETPFALMRFLSPWIMIICGIIFVLTYRKYAKKVKELSS
ncbi:DUF2812 domain-containing protein [Bacillus sp. CBEL-1]|uniref:DUF2812 domain-containing protein n=1 Tax=Bacillus sp. CBEL-1 TaxID=2502980 RepID=UPI001047DE14|nr:DUF2812 domain-containing protein [Bacillus sp. CBEL-1]TDB50098.1 DUF2812 domain-containing protein [Bacillus sp. CBEL-1]